MRTTGEKGIVFSIDLMISFLAIITMFYLILINFGGLAEGEVGFGKDAALWKNSVFLLDSMVKSFDENGFANNVTYFNAMKRRVESNVLDYAALRLLSEKLRGKGDLSKGDEFFVKEISLGYKNGGSETLFSSTLQGGNCFAVERLVIVNNGKAILKGVVCSE